MLLAHGHRVTGSSRSYRSTGDTAETVKPVKPVPPSTQPWPRIRFEARWLGK